MSDEIIRKVHVETDLEAYRNFFSDDWGERIFALTETAPVLSTLVFDLLMEWRAAAYTVSLPVSVIEHMKGYHDAFVNTAEINTTLLRLIPAVMGKLAPKVPDLSSDPDFVRRLQTEIVNIGAEIEEARGNTKIEFPLEETWRDYLKTHVYRLSLWGSQHIAFVSIYNSYDNFIAQLVRIALSLDDCRTAGKTFKKQLRDAFGEKLKEKCWTKNDLHIAREARHSLSHAGGRVTQELADIKPTHGFIVVDGRIQVTPDKTKALFALLKECAYSLAETAVGRPQFE